jgi:hypothetical protein
MTHKPSPVKVNCLPLISSFTNLLNVDDNKEMSRNGPQEKNIGSVAESEKK